MTQARQLDTVNDLGDLRWRERTQWTFVMRQAHVHAHAEISCCAHSESAPR